MADETRTIEQQLTDAVVAAINAAPDLPTVAVDQSWDVDPDDLTALGAIVLAAEGSSPVERQQLDDAADDRAALIGFAIWAPTRARADAIRARIQQLVCFRSPTAEGSPFFRLAKRIRPGSWSLETVPSGHALGKIQIHPDTKQLVTDPTRWK
jgi:hypothetical protein